MSEGTRVGIPTNLKISEPGKGGPKLRFEIDGMKCVAWPTTKDGGVEIPNPCIPAIKAAANEYAIAFDGWESIESDWTDQRGNTHKGKAQIAAQRLVEASASIYGEVFQDYYGIDAMGNKVQGGGGAGNVAVKGEGTNTGQSAPAPPTPPGWAETPPDAADVGAAFSGQPASVLDRMSPEQRAMLAQAPAEDPSRTQWLNSEYGSPSLGARLTAAACVFKAFDIGGDALIDEWKLDGEDVRKDKPRILARQVKEIAEALVRGDL